MQEGYIVYNDSIDLTDIIIGSPILSRMKSTSMVSCSSSSSFITSSAIVPNTEHISTLNDNDKISLLDTVEDTSNTLHRSSVSTSYNRNSMSMNATNHSNILSHQLNSNGVISNNDRNLQERNNFNDTVTDDELRQFLHYFIPSDDHSNQGITHAHQPNMTASNNEGGHYKRSSYEITNNDG